jgi:hypothetical protein
MAASHANSRTATTVGSCLESRRESDQHALIGYDDAAFAIRHCLPEVGILLDADEVDALVSRVLGAALEGAPEPPDAQGFWIRYRPTVSALAAELREQNAQAGRRSYQELAEMALHLPGDENLHPTGIRPVIVDQLMGQIGLGEAEVTRVILTGRLAEFLWSWRNEGHRVLRADRDTEARDLVIGEIYVLDDIVWVHRDQAYTVEHGVEIANRSACPSIRDTVAMLAFCMCRRDGYWPSWWRNWNEDPDRVLAGRV